MLILDTSAVVAVLLGGEDQHSLRAKVEGADVVAIGAPALLESAIVLSSRLDRDARPLLREFVRQFMIQVVPFDEDLYDAATAAWLKYGNGRHPAALNFGDCLTYAVAKLSGAPLLFIGNDFTQTDIVAA
jgi:ribonuclease VapC